MSSLELRERSGWPGLPCWIDKQNGIGCVSWFNSSPTDKVYEERNHCGVTTHGRCCIRWQL
jgi:hypothetical protein